MHLPQSQNEEAGTESWSGAHKTFRCIIEQVGRAVGLGRACCQDDAKCQTNLWQHPPICLWRLICCAVSLSLYLSLSLCMSGCGSHSNCHPCQVVLCIKYFYGPCFIVLLSVCAHQQSSFHEYFKNLLSAWKNGYSNLETDSLNTLAFLHSKT